MNYIYSTNYLDVCLSVSLPVYLSLRLSISMSICVSFYMSICSLSLSDCTRFLCDCPLVYPPTLMYFCLFILLSAFFSNNRSIQMLKTLSLGIRMVLCYFLNTQVLCFRIFIPIVGKKFKRILKIFLQHQQISYLTFFD